MRLHLNRPQHKLLRQVEERASKMAAVDVVKQICGIRALAEGGDSMEIAAALMVSPSLVEAWLRSWLLHEMESIVLEPGKRGPKPKLTSTQRKTVIDSLRHNPSHYGLGEGSWSTRRVRRLVQKLFGVHVGKQWACELLHQGGYSYQKTVSVSPKRDENERETWLNEDWTKLINFAEDHGHEVVFCDEARFNQCGNTGRTWAPKGSKPTVTLSDSKKGLNVIGGIEWFQGKIYGRIFTNNIDSCAVVHFLAGILKESKNHIHVIFDRAPTHRSQETWNFIKANHDRLTVHFLPAYSPDFNPIEKLWSRFKNHYLNNRFFQTLTDLCDSIGDTFRQFKKDPSRVFKIFAEYPHLQDAL